MAAVFLSADTKQGNLQGMNPYDYVGGNTVGMHMVQADGSIGLITHWTIVPGVKMMYNLEVAQDHTFTVGDGLWVVHNCDPAAYNFADKLINKVHPNNWNHILNNALHAADHDWSSIGVNSVDDLKAVMRETVAENHQDYTLYYVSKYSLRFS